MVTQQNCRDEQQLLPPLTPLELIVNMDFLLLSHFLGSSNIKAFLKLMYWSGGGVQMCVLVQ